MKRTTKSQLAAIPAAALTLALFPACTGLAFAADPAREMIEKSGISGGFIVHVGCGGGKLTADLRLSDAYVVHGLDTDPGKIKQARTRFSSVSHDGHLSAAVFDGRNLPYIDNLVNLVIVGNGKWQGSSEEITRVLAPGGRLLVQEILRPGPRGLIPQSAAPEGWHAYLKDVPAEIDEWTHYLHGPDGNTVSKDKAIKPPISHLQWRGSPRFSRHHDKSGTHLAGCVTANGRIFYMIDNGPRASVLWPPKFELVARDAFNGVILWRKELTEWLNHLAYNVKEGPAVIPRRLVAIKDCVYATLGIHEPVCKLDAPTGETLRVYEGTGRTEEIILDDGVLYLIVNPSLDTNPQKEHRNPNKVVAVNEKDGTVLWQTELSWIAPATLTLGGDTVFVCNGPKIVGLDRTSGKERWKSRDLPWRDKRFPTYFAPTLVAAPGGVLYAGGENWREHAGSAGLLTFLNEEDGSVRWQAPHLPSGYQSPQDIFVIDGLAWCGSLNSKPGEFDARYPEVAPSTGEFVGYDLKTGRLVKSISRDEDSYWFHHRCHRAKATRDFFLTSRTGIEIIDRHSGHWNLHHWVRGACLYGIMPANGLIYAPPHPCACYPEAKLSGFNALSGPRTMPDAGSGPRNRLVKGPACTEVSGFGSQVSALSWPTFRGNAARDGSTSEPVRGGLNKKWEVQLGGKLTQPVAANGKLYVASAAEHTITAIDQEDGRVHWKFVAGGRIDSPPTCYKGALLFGCTDGHVYCLRASDGELAWQFRAAPSDLRHMVYEQLESVWPVHGAVLVHKDVAYVTAGRSMFLEGGMWMYLLNPLTGEVLSREHMTSKDPVTGRELTDYIKVLNMPAASSDIMSAEGDKVFMSSQPFDLQGKRSRVRQYDLRDQKNPDTHLFAANGMLDASYWHRACWQYGTAVQGGHGYATTGKVAPAGKIMVLDDKNLYVFGRKPDLWRWTVPTEYSLYALDRSIPKPKPDKGKQNPRRHAAGGYTRRWNTDIPIIVRAMVKAGETLFVAGPSDIVDEMKTAGFASTKLEKVYAKQASLFAGSDGSILRAVSAGDGTKLKEVKLDAMPVFDGMIAASGSIYLSATGGKVIRLE